MLLKIISPERALYTGEVKQVTLPGASGLFMVQKDHAPLVSTLTSGDIIYVETSDETAMTIQGGVVEVINNKVTVCVS
jgi:F-type H+-transporting ATPase subunit epsilon